MKTVFIIGAGAHKEIGMPDGEQLIKDISNLLKNINLQGGQLTGDSSLIEYINIRNNYNIQNISKTLDILKQIADGLKHEKSIDNYLSSHDYQDDDKKFYCKLALVSVLLNYEKKCKLINDNHELTLDNVNDTWYEPFFRFLINSNSSNLEERLENIKIINFNYDRCFEMFIYHKLKSSFFDRGENYILKLFYSLEIRHPYGILGDLPFTERDKIKIDFIEQPKPGKILKLTENIKTFSEGMADKDVNTIQIRKMLNDADRLIFLGFAFHLQNLELLFSDNADFLPEKCSCYGTVYEIYDEDQSLIKKRLRKLLEITNLNLVNYECSAFMNKYFNTLIDEELPE